MRKAEVFIHDQLAGLLIETKDEAYEFSYLISYKGPPVSLTMPASKSVYHFKKFPAFFEGLLPEGVLLKSLLKREKIDRDDYFKQLMLVGADLVGAVTVREIK